MGGWRRWALVSPDGVTPSRMVGVSASVNLPLRHKVQKFSSGTGLPGWSRKKGRKTVVVWCCIANSAGNSCKLKEGENSHNVTRTHHRTLLSYSLLAAATQC